MYACHYPYNANPGDRSDPAAGGPRGWGFHGYGLPFPIKLLAVGLGFLIFKPLGLALLIYFLVSHRFGGGPWRHRFAPWRNGGPAARNRAFAERRRETLNALDEEEKAFDEFVEEQRQARDREAFERFLAERKAKDGGPTPAQ